MTATVVLCKCSKDHTFGMRIEKRPEAWYKTWAFKIDDKKARREGFDTTVIQADVLYEDGYPGCPYCKTHDFFICSCGKLNCFSGKIEYVSREVTCNWCSKRSFIQTGSGSFQLIGSNI